MNLKTGKEGELTQNIMDNFRHEHIKKMDEIEQLAYAEFKCDEDFFRTQWLPKYENDPQIKNWMEKLQEFDA